MCPIVSPDSGFTLINKKAQESVLLLVLRFKALALPITVERATTQKPTLNMNIRHSIILHTILDQIKTYPLASTVASPLTVMIEFARF